MIVVPNKDAIDTGLEELRILTKKIREHQSDVKTLSERRLKIILDLRAQGVTYKRMTDFMGTSYQNIYKIIKDYIPRDPQTGLAKKGRPKKEVIG